MSIIKELQIISNDHTMSLDTKLHNLLAVGTKILGLETGIVSNIRGDQYSILSVVTPGDSIPVNSLFALPDTYCADVVNVQSHIAYHDINCEPGASHPCFAKYTLRSYLAAPVNVSGEFFGTVNFSSLTPRQEPFTSIEVDYLLLLATWIGNELERQQVMENLHAQKAILAERNLLLSQVTNLAGVGTWELNLDTQALSWSGALKRMLHMHGEKILKPEDVTNLIADDAQRKDYIERFARMIKTGKDFVYELEVRTDAGEPRWLESRAHPIIENGRCTKVIGATMDITQTYLDKAVLQHKSELAENALKTRSEFLDKISHEIRTPIHGVLGMLEVLMGTSLNTKQFELASNASKSADSLLKIVNDILDFSNIEAGDIPFEEAATDLALTIEEQVPMFALLAKQKGLELNVNTENLKGKVFKADKLRLGQILLNLLNNAMKFTKEGNVTVETNCIRYGKGKFQVKIVVTDTGIGISEQQQKIIFSPFMQVENSAQRGYGGTGLGLSLVSKIAEHYQGNVDVNSHLGVGSRFTVTLMLDDATTGADIEKIYACRNDYTPTRQELSGLKALIVEDNEINQLVLKEQLKEIGLPSELATNGKEGVEKVKRSFAEKSPYAVIFMDCHMPVMDGLEATRHIRALGEQAKQIPIIALTANVLTGDKEKCLKSGMNDFISKPVGVSRLKECVFRHLSSQMQNNVSALKDPA